MDTVIYNTVCILIKKLVGLLGLRGRDTVCMSGYVQCVINIFGYYGVEGIYETKKEFNPHLFFLGRIFAPCFSISGS